MTTIKLLALDASSTCTGWSLFDSGEYVDSGYIDLHKNKNSEHRLYEMATKICELISHCNPDKIIMEDTFSTPNVSTLKVLANLAGAVKFYCYTNKIEVEMIMPSAWRKILGIQEKGAKRYDLKFKALEVADEQLGLGWLEEDRAEAVCIGLSVCVRDGLTELK